jgi:hypothetical protein
MIIRRAWQPTCPVTLKPTPMDDLIIETSRLDIQPDFISALRSELRAGGIRSGRLAIGDVEADPSMAYILWHDACEVPVSLLVDRETFRNERDTRVAAQALLERWKRRMEGYVQPKSPT